MFSVSPLPYERKWVLLWALGPCFLFLSRIWGMRGESSKEWCQRGPRELHDKPAGNKPAKVGGKRRRRKGPKHHVGWVSRKCFRSESGISHFPCGGWWGAEAKPFPKCLRYVSNILFYQDSWQWVKIWIPFGYLFYCTVVIMFWNP